MLGVSSLVDALNHAKPPGATEACVLGPFYTDDAHDLKIGDSIASEGKGDYMYVHGKVLDTEGKPIAGAIIDTWETDGDGLYDTQVGLLTFLATSRFTTILDFLRLTVSLSPVRQP